MTTLVDNIYTSAAKWATIRAELIVRKTGVDFDQILEDCVLELDSGPEGFTAPTSIEGSIWDEIITSNVHFSLAEKSAILKIARR